MNTVEFKYPLGSVLKDRFTGFSGVAMAQVKYLTGCVHYGLQGPMLEGKIPDWNYLDETRLDLVSEEYTGCVGDSGGPSQNPPQV